MDYFKKSIIYLHLHFLYGKKSAISRSFYPIILASFPETIEFHKLEFENLWIQKLELISMIRFPFDIKECIYSFFHCYFRENMVLITVVWAPVRYNQFFHFLAKELQKTWNHKPSLKDEFSNDVLGFSDLELVRDQLVCSGSLIFPL